MRGKDLIDSIYKRRDSSTKLGLERVEELLNFLDNPQKKLKCIHITGTNGKGSITTTISNVLINSGYKVGKYISPYVDNFFERIQINNKYIEEKDVDSILGEMLPFIEKMEDQPTPFEIITAIAFEYFYRNNCDIVCLEVGMGGRFDATNCINNTLMSIISVIDYDHMEYLGNTIEEIAFEKCGIIKENKITISYPLQPKNAYKMIKAMADIRNNKFIDIDLSNLTNIEKVDFNYKFNYKNKEYVLGLNGKHQIYNTLVAIEAINELNNLGYNISYDTLYNSIKDTRFIARLDCVRRNPYVVIDGAHNASGAKALKEFILENKNNSKLVLITAMKEGKQAEEYFKEIGPLSDNIIITEIKNKLIKSINTNELSNIIKKYNSNVEIELSHKEAYDKAISLCDKNDIIIIAGSLYLASEFYEILRWETI